MFAPNFACRFEKLGPGGRKCSCCNEFHGKTKSKLTRLVRRRLKKFFTAEIKREMSE